MSERMRVSFSPRLSPQPCLRYFSASPGLPASASRKPCFARRRWRTRAARGCARRAELVSLFGEGVISEQVYAELTAEVDSALASGEAAGNDRPRPSVELSEDD
jgi:hypothetical protein